MLVSTQDLAPTRGDRERAEAVRLAGLTDRALGRELLAMARAVRADFPSVGDPDDRNPGGPAYFLWQIVPEIAARLGAGETRIVGTSGFEPGERADSAIRSMPGRDLRVLATRALEVVRRTATGIEAQLDPRRGVPTPWDLLTRPGRSGVLIPAIERFAASWGDSSLSAERLWAAPRPHADAPEPIGARSLPPELRAFWGGAAAPDDSTPVPDILFPRP